MLFLLWASDDSGTLSTSSNGSFKTFSRSRTDTEGYLGDSEGSEDELKQLYRDAMEAKKEEKKEKQNKSLPAPLSVSLLMNAGAEKMEAVAEEMVRQDAIFFELEEVAPGTPRTNAISKIKEGFDALLAALHVSLAFTKATADKGEGEQ